MAKDAFDQWWEWVEKPADSPLTIPAYDATLTRNDDGGTWSSIVSLRQNRLHRRYGIWSPFKSRD